MAPAGSNAIIVYDSASTRKRKPREVELQAQLQAANAKAYKDALKITELHGELRKEKSMRLKYMDHLSASWIAEFKAVQLKAKLEEEHAAEVAKEAKLNQEHAATKAEAALLKAKVAKLNQEHAADIARVKNNAAKEVHDAKKAMVLALFPDMEASLLPGFPE